MTVRVGAKGQVVIPKGIRDQIGLHPGDEVDFEVQDNQVVLVAANRAHRPRRPLRRKWDGPPAS